MTDDETPWSNPGHDIAADFAAMISRVVTTEGWSAGIKTTAAISEPATSLTMEGMMRAMEHLRAHGFPRERPTVQVGDADRFRQWIQGRIPVVPAKHATPTMLLSGMDVLVDAELPPEVIEIREGDRVLRRIVLPTSPRD